MSHLIHAVFTDHHALGTDYVQHTLVSLRKASTADSIADRIQALVLHGVPSGMQTPDAIRTRCVAFVKKARIGDFLVFALLDEESLTFIKTGTTEYGAAR